MSRPHCLIPPAPRHINSEMNIRPNNVTMSSKCLEISQKHENSKYKGFCFPVFLSNLSTNEKNKESI